MTFSSACSTLPLASVRCVIAKRLRCSERIGGSTWRVRVRVRMRVRVRVIELGVALVEYDATERGLLLAVA